jgi:hypothetical protein
MVDPKVIKSQIVLANAAELAVGVILSTVGGDVSNSINGTRLGKDILNNMAQARFQKILMAKAVK